MCFQKTTNVITQSKFVFFFDVKNTNNIFRLSPTFNYLHFFHHLKCVNSVTRVFLSAFRIHQKANYFSQDRDFPVKTDWESNIVNNFSKVDIEFNSKGLLNRDEYKPPFLTTRLFFNYATIEKKTAFASLIQNPYIFFTTYIYYS